MKINNNYYSRRINMYNPNQFEIATAIYKLWKPGSVYDLGCGIGGYLEGFNHCGCKIRGSELGWDIANKYMSEIVKKNTYQHDATIPIEGQNKFDLVLSIEVAEHLEEKKSLIFCENMVNLANNRIFMTAALPGQLGSGHINCQTNKYWIDCMAIYGAKFSGYETKLAYDILTDIDKIGICKNIMIFRV